MDFQKQAIYSGFRLIEEQEIHEINSTGRLFIHEKSGAKLFYIHNDDDNKVFSIAFRTPPEDDTGLPHILEHSVLCGSRKFPTKEPFVELAKGSLNTFLNAMTFPDKTMYPVASQNEKDLFNLMDVYLDAVFHPNIYQYPEILKQEGWHYELNHKDEEITYVGVVYNEMKGAFSSPESILFRKIQESLFPDTIYAFESGGDPDAIPELTEEKFLAFHQKNYHPSNSYLFLYGNGNVLNQLEFIHEKYLKDFEQIRVDSHITFQSPFAQLKETIIEYPISLEESEKEKTFLSLNFAVGKSTDPETYLTMEILEHLLLETPAAPLKKALLDASLGKDVFGYFDNSLLQPVLSVVVKNSEIERKQKLQDIVFETLNKLVQNGIDKKLIEASVNIKEFKLREADYRDFPKGLFYCIQCMDSWLYDESPFLHLRYESILHHIKERMKSDYFEQLIDLYLLKNLHRSLLVVKPKKGLEDEKAKKLKEKLSAYKSTLPMEEIDQLVEQTAVLKKRQISPDSPEALAAIPILSLNDINPKVQRLPLEEKKEGDIPVLFHDLFTSSILYFNMYFDTRLVPQALLPYISLLTSIMGKISTEKYDYTDLSNEINIHTGGMHFITEAFSEKGDDRIFYPKLFIKSKAMTDKLPKLFEILGEVIGHTKFNYKKRLKEIIQERKSRMEMTIAHQGHVVAAGRVFSYFSPIGKYNEILSGFSYYQFISELEKNFDQRFDEISQNLKTLCNLIFNRKNLLISLTTEENDYGLFQKHLPLFLSHLGNQEKKPVDYQFDFSAQNEGLLTPGKVQYVVKGYNFKHLGYAYTGSLQVLKTIIALDYLWNRIRVQGGAYGSFASFSRNGNMFFGSYRDPNLRESLSIYDEVETYVGNFNTNDREMTKYIIGTISKQDIPLTPSMKGERAAANYICRISQEALQKERDEILNTTQEDVRKFADLLGDTMKQNYYAVLGNEGKIKENADLFKHLIHVFH